MCVSAHRLIPETKGRSLEEMDIIFGAVKEDKRMKDIAAQERGMGRYVPHLGEAGDTHSST